MTKKYHEIKHLLLKTKHTELSGRGAPQSEIKHIEKTLGISLPHSYKMFLEEHGWGYFGHLEAICGLGDDIPIEWRPGINLQQVVSDERKGSLSFPDYIIPFSSNGAGDWFAFDCSQTINGEAPVIFVSHEEVAEQGFCSEHSTNSFADWIELNLSEK